MPNPFVRIGAANLGKKPTDRPAPIPPVVQDIDEPVFAYRGIENHGVPVTGEFADVPGYGATRDAIYEIEPEPEHVIPVRIVQDKEDNTRQELRIVRTRVMSIGAEPVRVAGRNVRRQKITFRPSGTWSRNTDGTAGAADPAGGIGIGKSWAAANGADQFQYTTGGITARVISMTVSNTDTVAHTVTLFETSTGVPIAAVTVPAASAATVPATTQRFSGGLTYHIDAAPATASVLVGTNIQRDSNTVAVYYASNRGDAQNGAVNGFPLADATNTDVSSQDELWLCAPGVIGTQLIPVAIAEDIVNAN